MKFGLVNLRLACQRWLHSARTERRDYLAKPQVDGDSTVSQSGPLLVALQKGSACEIRECQAWAIWIAGGVQFPLSASGFGA